MTSLRSSTAHCRIVPSHANNIRITTQRSGNARDRQPRASGSRARNKCRHARKSIRPTSFGIVQQLPMPSEPHNNGLLEDSGKSSENTASPLFYQAAIDLETTAPTTSTTRPKPNSRTSCRKTRRRLANLSGVNPATRCAKGSFKTNFQRLDRAKPSAIDERREDHTNQGVTRRTLLPKSTVKRRKTSRFGGRVHLIESQWVHGFDPSSIPPRNMMFTSQWNDHQCCRQNESHHVEYSLLFLASWQMFGMRILLASQPSLMRAA